MGPLYCDASALAKLFAPEQGSEEINELLLERDDVLVSDLGFTELISALARRAREGSLEPTSAKLVHRQLLAIAAQGAVRRVELDARGRGAPRGRGDAVRTPERPGEGLVRRVPRLERDLEHRRAGRDEAERRPLEEDPPP